MLNNWLGYKSRTFLHDAGHFYTHELADNLADNRVNERAMRQTHHFPILGQGGEGKVNGSCRISNDSK